MDHAADVSTFLNIQWYILFQSDLQQFPADGITLFPIVAWEAHENTHYILGSI